MARFKFTDRNKMPYEFRYVVDLCQDAAFDGEGDTDYPCSKTEIDVKGRRVQVRDDRHYTPPAQVNKYELGWKMGEKYPPIVITRNGYLVDGNTRVMAAQNIGRERIPAIILDVEWAPPESTYTKEQREINDRIISLGAGLNMRNGEGIDRRELYKCLRALDPTAGYDIHRVAHRYMCPPGTVKNIFDEGQALVRAEAVGLEPKYPNGTKSNGALNPSQLRELGKYHTAFSDDIYHSLFSLVEDSGMDPKDLRTLVKSLRASTSDEARATMLANERTARQEQITAHTAWGKQPHPPLSSQVLQHAGFFLKYEEYPEKLLERNPNRMGEYVDRLMKTANLLQEVARRQAARGL